MTPVRAEAGKNIKNAADSNPLLRVLKKYMFSATVRVQIFYSTPSFSPF